MFDISKPVNYKQPHPKKAAKLRFPSDEQFIKRLRAVKTRIRRFRNGESESTVDGLEEVDFALFGALRAEGDSGEEFEDAEASFAIEQMTQAEVVDAEETDDGGIAITLHTPWGEVKHVLKMPTRKQLSKWSKNRNSLRDGRFNTWTVKRNPAVDLEFYKELSDKTEGYAGAPPLFHMIPVVEAVETFIDDVSESFAEDQDF